LLNSQCFKFFPDFFQEFFRAGAHKGERTTLVEGGAFVKAGRPEGRPPDSLTFYVHQMKNQEDGL
ncbi:MAG: hypothetical protein AAB692_06350, partial [Patescibacteria group bacterium]